MLGQCESIDPTLAGVSVPALNLTDFATQFRYPGDGDAMTLDEARELLTVAQIVVTAVSERLGLQSGETPVPPLT